MVLELWKLSGKKNWDQKALGLMILCNNLVTECCPSKISHSLAEGPGVRSALEDSASFEVIV
jgi:hypothetical protein